MSTCSQEASMSTRRQEASMSTQLATVSSWVDSIGFFATHPTHLLVSLQPIQAAAMQVCYASMYIVYIGTFSRVMARE
jgi:hypothetical protein